MDFEVLHASDETVAPVTSINTRFWPSRSAHKVHVMALADPATCSVSPELAAELATAARLSDALRAVESRQSEASAPIKVNLANALRRAAKLEPCAESAWALELRARLIDGADPAIIAPQLIDANETGVVAICGPLTTWLGKSRLLLHSGLFAKADTEVNAQIAALDAAIPDVKAHLNTLIDPRLTIDPPPRITFTDLMFCGGEASFYPKHFAYFLPEDEGVKKAPVKKTVVLSNVYTAMYQTISKGFSEDLLVGVTEGSDAAIREALAFWFRGHDICHGVRFPDTDYGVMRCTGYWNSMVLQEAIADVFGFVLMNTGPWKSHFRLGSLDINATVYMREALRYLCRGNLDFPDAGAAMIQLSYLVKNGYVDIDEQDVTLRFDPPSVLEGLTGLAVLLADTALSNDEAGIRSLISEYFDNGITAFIQKCGVCETVLDYVETTLNTREQ